MKWIMEWQLGRGVPERVHDKLCWVTQAEAVETQRKRQVKWITGKTFKKQMMTKKIRGESLV